MRENRFCRINTVVFANRNSKRTSPTLVFSIFLDWKNNYLQVITTLTKYSLKYTKIMKIGKYKNDRKKGVSKSKPFAMRK